MPFNNEETRGLYNQSRRLKLQSVLGKNCKGGATPMCVVVEQVEDYNPSEETVSESESLPGCARASPNQNESRTEDVVGEYENQTESLATDNDNCQLVTSCFPWLHCAHRECQGCACVGGDTWEGNESVLPTEHNQTGCFPWRGGDTGSGEEQAPAVENTQPGCSPWCTTRARNDCNKPIQNTRTWFPRCLQTESSEILIYHESTGSKNKCMPMCIQTVEDETVGNTNNSSVFDRSHKPKLIFNKHTTTRRTYVNKFISEKKEQYLCKTFNVISSTFNDNQNANTKGLSTQTSGNPRRTNRTSFRSARSAAPGTTNSAKCPPDTESFRTVPQRKLLTTPRGPQQGTRKGQDVSQWQRLRFKSPSPETSPVRINIEKNREYVNNSMFYRNVESNCSLTDFVRNQWRNDEQSGTPDYDLRYISSADGGCGKTYPNEYNNVDDYVKTSDIQNNDHDLSRNTSLQSMLGSDMLVLDDRESTIVSRLFAQDDMKEYLESLSDDDVDMSSVTNRPHSCTPYSQHRNTGTTRRVHLNNLDLGAYPNNEPRHDRSAVDQYFDKSAYRALHNTFYRERYPRDNSKPARVSHNTDGYYHDCRENINFEATNGYQPHLLNKTSNAGEKGQGVQKQGSNLVLGKTFARPPGKGQANPNVKATPSATGGVVAAGSATKQKSAKTKDAKTKDVKTKDKPKKKPIATESDTENTYNIDAAVRDGVIFAPEENLDPPAASKNVSARTSVEIEPVTLSEITEEKPKPKKKTSRRRKEEPSSEQLSKRDLEKMMKTLIATTCQIGKHIEISSSEEEDVYESETDVEEAQNNAEPPKDDDLARRQKAFEDALLGYQLARATASQWDEGAAEADFERTFKKAYGKKPEKDKDSANLVESIRIKNKSRRPETCFKKVIDEDDDSMIEETLSLCKVTNKRKQKNRGCDEPVMERKQKRKCKEKKSDTEGEYSLCEDTSQSICKMKNKKPAKCACTEIVSERKRKCTCNGINKEILYEAWDDTRNTDKQNCKSETVFERKVECTCNRETNDRKPKRTSNEKKATNEDEYCPCEENMQTCKRNKRKKETCACDGMKKATNEDEYCLCEKNMPKYKRDERKKETCACDGMTNDALLEDNRGSRAYSRKAETPKFNSETIVERKVTCTRNGVTNEGLFDRTRCCGSDTRNICACVEKNRGKMYFDEGEDLKGYDSTITEDAQLDYHKNRSTPNERISDYKDYRNERDDSSPMSRDYIYKAKEPRHTHDDSGQYMSYGRQNPYDPPQRVDKDYGNAYEENRKYTSGGCQTFEPLKSTHRDAVAYINGINRSAKNMPYSSPAPFELQRHTGKYTEPDMKRNAIDNRSFGQNVRRSEEWPETRRSKHSPGKRYSVDDDEVSYAKTESICSSVADPYSGRSETRPMVIKQRIELSRPDKANKRLQCEVNIPENPKLRSSYDYDPYREPRPEYNVPKYQEYDDEGYKRPSTFRPSTSLGLRPTTGVQNCGTQCTGERCVIESRSTTYPGPPRRGPANPMMCTNKKCQIGSPTRLGIESFNNRGNDYTEQRYERRTFCKNENRAKMENCCQPNEEGVKETPVVHIHYRARPNTCSAHPHSDLARLSNGRRPSTANAPCTPNDKVSMKQQIAGILEHTKNIQKAAQTIHRNRKEGEGKDGGAFVHCYNGNCSSLERKRIMKCTCAKYNKDSEDLKSQTRGITSFRSQINNKTCGVETIPQSAFSKNHEFIRSKQLRETVPKRHAQVSGGFDSTCHVITCPNTERYHLHARCPSDKHSLNQMKEIENNLEYLKEATKPFKQNMAKLCKLLLREPMYENKTMKTCRIHNTYSGLKTGCNSNMNANSNGSNQVSCLPNANDNAKAHTNKKVSFTINNSSQNMAKSSVYLSLSPKRVSVTVSKNGDRVKKTMLLRSGDSSKNMEKAKQQYYSIAEPYEETLQYLRANEMELSSSYKDQKRNYKSRPLPPRCKINSVLDNSIQCTSTNKELLPKVMRTQPGVLRPQCYVNRNQYVHATVNPKNIHNIEDNITGNRCEQKEQPKTIFESCKATKSNMDINGDFACGVLSKQPEKSCIATVKMDSLGAKDMSPISAGDDSKSSAYGIEDIPYDQLVTKHLHTMNNKRKKTKQHKYIISDMVSLRKGCENRTLPYPPNYLKNSTNNVFSQTETSVCLINGKGRAYQQYRNPLLFEHRDIESPPKRSPTLSSSSVELESHILTPTKYKLHQADDFHTVMMREKGTQTPTKKNMYASTCKPTLTYPSIQTKRYNHNFEHSLHLTHGVTVNKDILDLYTKARHVPSFHLEHDPHPLALATKTKSKENIKYVSDKSLETTQESFFNTNAVPHKNKTLNNIPSKQESSLENVRNASIFQNHLISWWNSDKSLEQRKLLKHLLKDSKHTQEDTTTSASLNRTQSVIKTSIYNNPPDQNKASSGTPAYRRPLPLPRHHMAGISMNVSSMQGKQNVRTLSSLHRNDATKVQIMSGSRVPPTYCVPCLPNDSPPACSEASVLRHRAESRQRKQIPKVSPPCLEKASANFVQGEPERSHRDTRASYASEASCDQQCSLFSAGTSPKRKCRSRQTRNASSSCEKKLISTPSVENKTTGRLETTSCFDRPCVGEVGKDGISKSDPTIGGAVVEDDWHQHRVTMGSIVEANERRVVIEGFYTIGISDQEKNVGLDTSTNKIGKFPMKSQTFGFRIVLFGPVHTSKKPKVTGTYMCEMEAGKFFKWRVQSIVSR